MKVTPIHPESFPLLDHMTSGLLAIDRHGRIVLWNRQMEHWTGQTRAIMIGKQLFDVFPELGESYFRERIGQVLEGGAPVVFSPQLHHHVIPCPLDSGDMRIQKTTVSYLPEHQLALFCIDDLTEQSRLIAKLGQTAAELKQELGQRLTVEKKNRHLLAAIDQAGEAIIITNRAGDIEYVNEAFYLQTGWSKEETLAIAVYDGLFSDRMANFDQIIVDVFGQGLTWQGRQDIIRKDGSVFTASISIAPIADEQQTITHAIIIQEDISTTLELERKIGETQKQEALFTLVGGIAHDFNNLLAGITGQTYLASREVKDMPKTAERMQKLQNMANEAAEIVSQLLTFARQGQINSKEMPLGSFLKEFCKLASHNVPESIALNTNIMSKHVNFRGDANQLQQALLNIVQNAVESCQNKGKGHIEIGLVPFDDSIHADEQSKWLQKYPVLQHGHFSHLYIKDSGTGIHPENIGRIFDPFYTTKQMGSGLGLAMVMGCIRHHHGIIDVESVFGQGTTFHIFLPLKTDRQQHQAAQSGHGGKHTNILLVDDDPRVLEPTQELLEAIGHNVTLAVDGQQAWDVFQQTPEHWDIVISDMVMPHMNGLESTRLMRNLRPDIPIIFATAYDQSLVLDDTRKMDNAILLNKPFNPDELDKLINEKISG